MALLLKFPETSKIDKAKPSFFGPAQVLMFTGVRFERLHPETAPDHRARHRLPALQNQATAEDWER